MSFPNKKFFGLIKDGWKDLGMVGNYYNEEGNTFLSEACSFCKTTVSIGLEKGKVFKYCGTCLIKLKERKVK